MNKSRLFEILERIKNTNVGVVGDFCLDAYWQLDTSPPELSLETGKPTQAVVKQRYSLGAAGNIVNNLVDIGTGKVYAFGVTSDDLFGRELLLQLKKQHVETSGIIIQNTGWDTSVYAKPYLGMEEQNRIDFGRFNIISADAERRLIEQIKRNIPNINALIINQQLSTGIYSSNLVNSLNEIAAKYPEKIFILDSRNRSSEFFNMICKLNASEAARVCGKDHDSSEFISIDELKNYARQIIEQPHKAVFITRGRRGILMYDSQRFTEIPGIQILKKIDPVGAGDTTVSAIAVVLASGGTFEEASIVSNLASSVTIQKLQQTGTASPEELADMWENADYVYRPELADDTRRAKILKDSEIEIVAYEATFSRIEHAIFDHDGTISTLRQGWEDIMEPVMVRSILGDHYETAEEQIYQLVLKRVREYIDQSTGIETIHQMHALVEMVQEFGFVPKDKVLDSFGYKKIYNDALMKLVSYRINRLKSGELSISDFTIKGVTQFLEILYNHGIKLYLASGTDREDVVREVESLGYAHLFEGRIYGYTGNAAVNTKRIVVESIIRENKLYGLQLACFGDGPVELRETKKQGGIAIGVASDEIRRYGLNLTKRNRLIKAGADLVIPDFSQYEKLIQMFTGELVINDNVLNN